MSSFTPRRAALAFAIALVSCVTTLHGEDAALPSPPSDV